MKKHAFTLIELLVVIAIIAILAAILFPVFAQAKMAAKKTVTTSGMKQMSMGVMLYMQDADDTFPMGAGACWWVPLDGGWTYDTQPYVKNLELLRDSVDPKEKNGWPSWLKTDSNGVNISFVSNGMLQWDGTATSLFGVMGLVQNLPDTRCGPQNWMGRAITNSTAVTQPSGTIMFAERFRSQPTWGTGLFLAGQDWWDKNSGFPGLLPDGTRNGAKYEYTTDDGQLVSVNKDNRNGAVSAPFSNKGVFAIADGSAKVMDPKTTNPDPNNKPDKNMWNAYR